MINPYYFIHKVSQVADNNNLDSHQRKHLNSKINISPNYFGIEKKTYFTCSETIVYQLCRNLKVNINFLYQTVFSTRFDKHLEDDQVLDGIDLYEKLKIHQNLTQSDTDNRNIRSQLQRQIQNEATEEVVRDKISLIQ